MASLQERMQHAKLTRIVAKNAATVLFYRNMSLTVGAAYSTIFYFFFHDQMCPLVMCMNLLVTTIYIMCYHGMRYLSQPEYSMLTYRLISAGHDLNEEGGIGEHLKDIVIIASVAQLMALISNKFWLTLLFIPLKGIWLFWGQMLEPWVVVDDMHVIETVKKLMRVDKAQQTK